jgi:hypothetical protein
VTTIVIGHGDDPDGEETFVPAGVTVRFYSAENVVLDDAVALFALLDKAGDPGLPITGDAPIKNYRVYTTDDQFIAQWLAIGGQAGGDIKWVGTDIANQTRLCDDPDRNTSTQLTCRAVGEHNCKGVLGLLKGETDIAILACRVSAVAGAVAGGATATSYDAQAFDQYPEDVLARLRSADAGQVAEIEKEVDGLPQEKIAVMIVTDWYADWQRARWLKEYALQNDLAQFFGQLTSNQNKLDGLMVWLDTIPSYGQAVDSVATAYPQIFYQWFDQAIPAVQDALKGRNAIERVVAEEAEAESLKGLQQMFEGDASNP